MLKSKRLIDLFYILQSTESYYSNTSFVNKNTSIEQGFFSSKNETCLTRKLNYKSRNDCNFYLFFHYINIINIYNQIQIDSITFLCIPL